MPNGAKSRTARNAKQRGIPNNDKRRSGAKGENGTARSGTRDGVPPSVAVRDFALFGIPRRSGFGAVRHLAPFGISRRSASRAVRHLAPFRAGRGVGI